MVSVVDPSRSEDVPDKLGNMENEDNDGMAEDLIKVLADQLAEVQLLLTKQHERAKALAARQAEARRSAKKEVSQLRKQLDKRDKRDAQLESERTEISSLVPVAPSREAQRPQCSSPSGMARPKPGSCDMVPTPSDDWRGCASCEVIAEPMMPRPSQEVVFSPVSDPPNLEDSIERRIDTFLDAHALVEEAELPGTIRTSGDRPKKSSNSMNGSKVCFKVEESDEKCNEDGNKSGSEGAIPKKASSRNCSQRSLTAPNLDKMSQLQLVPIESLKSLSHQNSTSSRSGFFNAASRASKMINSIWTGAQSEANLSTQSSMASQPSFKNTIRKSMTRNIQIALGVESRDTGNHRGGHPAVFADAAAMKEKVRQALGKEEYNVANFYKEHGLFQWIARSTVFEQLTLVVIAANSLWIAIDADENPAAVLNEAPIGFQIAEHSFATYFFVEWVVRFLSFREKRFCVRDSWFVFDSCLVLMMVIETWLMNLVLAFIKTDANGLGNTSMLRLIRLLRLTRMGRMVRLLRAMPELMIMIKGMAVAMRSVFFTLFLLLIIIYLFAIVFRQLTDGLPVGARYFKSIPDGMITLLLKGTLPDLADLIYDVAEEGIIYAIVLLTFILFATLTVMNMLVGVLCEVVSIVSAVEKEQLVVTFVKSKLQCVFKECVGDFDDRLGKEQFQDLLGHPQAAKALHDVGVDVVGLMEITDFLFKDGRTVDFPNFMEMLLELRGTNTATVKHIVDLQRFVHLELRRAQKDMVEQVATLSDLMAEARKDPNSKKTVLSKITRHFSQLSHSSAELEGELERGSVFGGHVQFDAEGSALTRTSRASIAARGSTRVKSVHRHSISSAY